MPPESWPPWLDDGQKKFSALAILAKVNKVQSFIQIWQSVGVLHFGQVWACWEKKLTFNLLVAAPAGTLEKEEFQVNHTQTLGL